MVFRNISILLNNVIQHRPPDKEIKSNFALAYVALFTLALVIYTLRRLFPKEASKKGVKVPQMNRVMSWFTPFDLVYYFWRLKKDGMELLDKYVAKHGKFFRVNSIGMRHYIISDPDIVQKLLTSTDPRYRNKPWFFKLIFDISNIHGGIFGASGDKWSSRRKLLSRPFTHKSLQSYLGSMNTKGRKMVEEMTELLSSFENGTNFVSEKARKIQDLCIMKIGASVIMGTDIFTEQEITDFHEDFEIVKKALTFRLFHPWTVFDTLFRLYPERNKSVKSKARQDVFLGKLLKTYKEQHEKLKSEGNLRQVEEDISVGLRPQRSLIEEMICDGLSDEDILTEICVFIIGAYETLTSALNTLLLHLALNLDVQSKCHQEIDHLDSEPENDGFTMEHLSNLKYLERCILENLRLAPSIPLIERGLETPFRVDENIVIEKGSNMLINIWGIQRDPEIFEDPLKFEPDRFLPENVKTRHKAAFLPFSLGVRNCIAWKMGVMELKVVMAWLLRNFEISTRDPIQYKDIRFMYELSVKPENDVNFIFKKRNLK